MDGCLNSKGNISNSYINNLEEFDEESRPKVGQSCRIACLWNFSKLNYTLQETILSYLVTETKVVFDR